MKDDLKVLDSNEEMTILYRGKVKGVIPSVNNIKKKVKDRPFFGMLKSSNTSVSKEMRNLRERASSGLSWLGSNNEQ